MFKKFSSGSEEKVDFSITLEEFNSDSTGQCDVIVYGPEQAGKTTLAKFFIEDARHQGITPLYLDASKLRSTNRGDVTGWINSALSYQYEGDCVDLVKQLELSKKVVLVDNLHQVPGNAKVVRDIVERLQLLGGRRMFLTAQNPAITLLAASNNSGDDVRLWSEAKWYELLPLNNKRRGDLIRRWAALGRDEHSDSESIEADVRQIKALFDGVLGRNFMPKYPFFLLVLLQQIEVGRDVNTIVRNGSHGHIFEALITASFENNLRCHEIGVTHDFLSLLAFRMWGGPESSISESGFIGLIREFQTENLIQLSHPQLINELIAAKVLQSEGGVISFRYNYFYYYYLARWISSHRSSEDAGGVLDGFVETIHTETSANVVMFVAHLGHEQWVIEKLIPAAANLFSTAEECRLSEKSVLAAKYAADQKEVVLLVGDPTVVSDHHHAVQDQMVEVSNEQMEDAFKFNTAVKIIQALGQVLRSRAGGIGGEQKVAIATASISLARRLMTNLYEVAEDSAEFLIENASEIFETEVKVDSREARNMANRLVAAVIGGIAKSLVSRAADVFGTRELMPLIDRMDAIAQASGDLDNALIVLVARIGAERDYPRERVEAMLKKLRLADVLPRAALAHAVVRGFYLQPPPHAIRDSACARLGIQIRNVPTRLQGLPKPRG